MTTDENGVAVSEPLRKGRYLVREHGETAGYVFEEITLDATVKSDETTDLSATNQPVMTRIRIKKRDKDEYAQTDAPSVHGDGGREAHRRGCDGGQPDERGGHADAERPAEGNPLDCGGRGQGQL